MRELIILGNGKSAIECPLDAEVWASSSYDVELFPIDEIRREFGIVYFRLIESYMLAHAIYLGYEKIRIYGVDFNKDDIAADKPRIAFWIGVAKGRGIKVEIGKKSRLYRVMKENVKDRYNEARAFIKEAKNRGFNEAAQDGIEPYCFVSGVGKDDVKFITRNKKGEVVAEWHS